MSFAKLRQDYTPLPPAPAPQLTVEFDGVAATPSPARALQQQLVQRTFSVEDTDIQRWSPRRSLALIVSVSAALWLALLMAGAEVVKAIA